MTERVPEKEIAEDAGSRVAPHAAYDQTALVLQGGGALGAYQAGAYESLDRYGVRPDWVAGISIGAINAAIIAGNAPTDRVAKLISFWTKVTSSSPLSALFPDNPVAHRANLAVSTLRSLIAGAPGFFAPRPPLAWAGPFSLAPVLSHYDTAPLRDTLLDHVDFDRINGGETRLSLGAVNVRTGNFAYFDSAAMAIGPEHVMASGALPPGFPPIEIEGEYYWDGGLVSNTPLSYVLQHAKDDATLILQVDLFSAVGRFPEDLGDVEERRKDIVYSSRTRLNTDAYRREHALRKAVLRLGEALTPEQKTAPGIADLLELATMRRFSIVHLIYRPVGHDGPTKDFEFSRRSMEAHWAAGRDDTCRTLRMPDWRVPPDHHDGIAVFDLNRAGIV